MTAVALEPLAWAHADVLRALHQQPGVLRWWGPMEADFPFDEPESTRFAILADGQIAGMIQFGEEKEPDYRHAWIDIFLGDDFTGRGIGTEAVRKVIEIVLTEHGHHRITIDPVTDNATAIRSYEKAGFRPVGVMEAAWRDPNTGEWRDELLMEVVVRP
jgi:aminoglycoside 6'-N-acetyltransferase